MLVLTVLGVVVIAATSIGGIRDSRVTPLRADSTITVGDDQLAIYARTRDGIGTPVTFCAVTSGSGERTVLEDPHASVEVQRWGRVALTPPSLAPGRYELDCTEQTPATLGVGVNPPLASLVVRFLAALAVGGLGVTVSLVLLVVTIVRRHRAAPAR
ncbi:hypothetical protein [Solicola sp. PLA-1-18]|uniref:hypothetical protein n=1 Tax=Solicola sp. PLA-1-18 TaxID=3380532 RepID=UPI003B7D0AF5